MWLTVYKYTMLRALFQLRAQIKRNSVKGLLGSDVWDKGATSVTASPQVVIKMIFDAGGVPESQVTSIASRGS